MVVNETKSGLVSRRRMSAQAGFTLVELLLVMVIIAILAAVVVPKMTGRTDDAKIAAAKADITSMKTALETYEIDNGNYPTQDQGLQALVTNPGNATGWKHQYIEKVPVDPWGNAYIYRIPGQNGNDYDLLSAGKDGQEGTADDVKP